MATDGFWGGGAAIVFSCEPIEELIRVTQMILVKLVDLKNKTKHRKIAATSHEAGKGWGWWWNRSEKKIETVGSYSDHNVLYACMKLSKNKLSQSY